MTSATSMFEVGAVVLGYVGNVASWRRPAPGAEKLGVDYRAVIVATSSSTDEGVHEPATSVSIRGRVALLALRAAIDEALKEAAAS